MFVLTCMQNLSKLVSAAVPEFFSVPIGVCNNSEQTREWGTFSSQRFLHSRYSFHNKHSFFNCFIDKQDTMEVP